MENTPSQVKVANSFIRSIGFLKAVIPIEFQNFQFQILKINDMSRQPLGGQVYSYLLRI
jgi:hypothetical protein